MSADEPTDSMLLSGKRESEGKHHLVGLLVGLSGVFVLAQGVLSKKFPPLAHAPPAMHVGTLSLVTSTYLRRS